MYIHVCIETAKKKKYHIKAEENVGNKKSSDTKHICISMWVRMGEYENV